jgi:hypothetical protein
VDLLAREAEFLGGRQAFLFGTVGKITGAAAAPYHFFICLRGIILISEPAAGLCFYLHRISHRLAASAVHETAVAQFINAAKLLGRDPRTIRHWLAGERAIGPRPQSCCVFWRATASTPTMSSRPTQRIDARRIIRNHGTEYLHSLENTVLQARRAASGRSRAGSVWRDSTEIRRN